MATKPIKIELDLSDRDAKKKVKALTKEIGNTEDSLEDAESAGKQMAKAIGRAADDMIDEIDDTKRAVDALDRALGPEFDADTREVVADLKAVGLTARDIEGDADELAAALRKSGDVKLHATKAGFDDVGQAVGSVRDETGKTRDTMSGFVGGTVGELPLISEAMGPVSEGLGQLTEGAIEGEVNLKQMAMAGVGMGAAVFVLKQVTGHLENAAAVKAFKSDQVDAYTEALGDADDVIDGITDKLEGQEGILVNFFGDDLDITDTINGVGLSVDNFAKLVAGGEQDIDAWAASMADAGIDSDALGLAVHSLKSESEALTKSQDATAASAEFFGDAQEDSEDATERAEQAVESHTEALGEQAAALQENIDKITEQIDAQLSAVDATYALEQSQWDLDDAVAETAETLETAEKGSREYREAELKVIDAAGGVAAAQLRVAEETAAANGKTLTATQRTDTFNLALLSQAGTLNGPARQALIDHLGQLNGLPDEVVTAIEAALNEGDIETAETLLNTASRTRTASVRADTDRAAYNQVNADLDRLALSRYVPIRPRATTGKAAYYASGTPYAPGGRAIVGEEGPEEIDLPQGASVTRAAKTAGLRRGGGSTVVNNNIVQYFPAGTRPQDVTTAQRKYSRTQGPL